MPTIESTTYLPTKQCTKCHQAMSATSEYFFVQGKPERLIAQCKSCMAKKNKEWVQNNREKSRGYTKKHRLKHREALYKRSNEQRRKKHADNPEKLRIQARVRRSHNLDTARAKQRAYYAKHAESVRNKTRKKYADRKAKTLPLKQYPPEKLCPQCLHMFPSIREHFYRANGLENGELHSICKKCFREKVKNYQSQHKEERRKTTTAYRATHRAEANARRKAWVQENPEKDAANHQTRRARKANAPINNFTAAQWRDMQEHYKHCCVYCKKRFKGKLTQDHITPLSKGGAHTYANIVPACRSCNSRKHANPPPIAVQPLLVL